MLGFTHSVKTQGLVPKNQKLQLDAVKRRRQRHELTSPNITNLILLNQEQFFLSFLKIAKFVADSGRLRKELLVNKEKIME